MIYGNECYPSGHVGAPGAMAPGAASERAIPSVWTRGLASLIFGPLVEREALVLKMVMRWALADIDLAGACGFDSLLPASTGST